MKIIIGSDHGGVQLKQVITNHLLSKNIIIEDIGPYSDDSVDFPLYAKRVAQAVSQKKADLGILCCGTGIGMSMAANKIDGVRAAVVSDSFSAKASRSHNNANVLCLGQRVIGEGLAINLVDIWLATDFEGGRHEHRLKLLAELENKTEEIL